MEQLFPGLSHGRRPVEIFNLAQSHVGVLIDFFGWVDSVVLLNGGSPDSDILENAVVSEVNNLV